MNLLDLELLKWLQEWRTPGIEQFFLKLTRGGEGFWILAVLGILFWLGGARWAYRIGFALAIGDLLTGLLKNMFCIPRPWLRDLNILPSPAAQAGAVGYSFPSGHVANTAVLWGGLARLVRRWWLWGPVGIWIGLMATSRLVLGVHTLWDVLGSLAVAVIAIWSVWGLEDWLEAQPSRSGWVVLGAAGLALVAWALLQIRPLPAEESQILPPQDAYRSIGGLLGFAIGWYVERRWIRYDPVRLGGYRLLGAVLGVWILSLMIEPLPRLLALWLGVEGGAYVAAAANPLWIFAIWPFFLKGLERTGR